MVVGEGPGRDEDETGRPFVGRAGKVLDSALESAGVDRQEVFITNVVKCRPPRNRVPSKVERQTCAAKYLLPQMELVRPELVILLGRTASLVLLQERTLRNVRGRVTRIGGRQYLSTYHPAAILRNPNLKRTFNSDLKKVRRIVRLQREKEG
jgi:DNA polymerase